MKKLIIVPTYNEKDNIDKIAPKVLEQDDLIDILIVDDNSPDGTGELADEMARDNSRIKVLHRKGKLGLGSAYVAGFNYGIEHKYDLIFEMDADFSHDPKYIPELIKASEEYNLVLGSRWVKGGGVEGWPWYRYTASWGANLAARLLLSLKPKDITSGFRCYHREVLEGINLHGIISSGYAFQEELIYRTQKAGFSIGEIPITFVDRKEGQSKMTKKEIITSSKAIIKLFMHRRGVGQIVKFGIIGATGTAIDFGILNILAVVFKVNVYLSASISFIVAATNNFYWNKRWTFRGAANNKKMHLQFVQYLIVAGIGFSLNLVILRICVPAFSSAFKLENSAPLVVNLSKVVSTLLVMTWNFLGSKKWVFKG